MRLKHTFFSRIRSNMNLERFIHPQYFYEKSLLRYVSKGLLHENTEGSFFHFFFLHLGALEKKLKKKRNEFGRNQH